MMIVGYMNKSLKEISWNVSEEEYRKDSALSYSTLSRFQKCGFNELDHLFDKVESPSLTFGSAVDSIITGGEEEFNSRFLVAEFPNIPDSIISIVKTLYDTYSNKYKSITAISDKDIIDIAASFNYQNNWKPETRAKVIKEKGAVYYKLLYLSQDKTIISTDTYNDVCKVVESLRMSPSTKWYFSEGNPFDNVERLYQLKFKATLGGVDYRCMVDLLVVDYSTKEIWLIDLKTSGKPEWDFYKSFVDWNYQIQARLYWRIIRYNLDKDPYFKDFILHDCRFIVANRKTLVPLAWECEFTQTKGTVTIGDYTFIDPEDIGQELSTYLKYNLSVPIGIVSEEPNSLTKWLSK